MSHTKTRIAIGASAAFALSVIGAAGIAVAAGTAPSNSDVGVSEEHPVPDAPPAPMKIFTPPTLHVPSPEPPGSFDTASVGPFEPAAWR
ncbi:hypothetical protein FXW78_36290 [Rhodococcus opacus]|nr:hypothetical protein [Rhodococcus opacus]RZL76102.1 MAG: hypothetical protein EOP32_29960 [Rhodococcus sp. (in: high G+C Gram-positive bacteria)]